MEMAQLRAELEQTRQDFLDLQNRWVCFIPVTHLDPISSKEVERQLEEDLALAEKKASQYEELTKKLQDQIAQLRQSLSDSAIRVSSLQEDNQRLTEQLAQSMEERKKLEQQNDLLEQRERSAYANRTSITLPCQILAESQQCLPSVPPSKSTSCSRRRPSSKLSSRRRAHAVVSRKSACARNCKVPRLFSRA